ncbi:hypothetical protein [Streptomyces cathayae]|uniref:Mycothiol-dependent maleylpyruvate isomerase metal-binding domain-containing protein n=1 Tax=Streptomyces cathayae TaxID=3031124 RepID=A0ABY8JSV0_9ACTN|nr:hypothetical protein [Streptomyces sp. HUAS 5]WGD38727.1 hypothetical protein PYS65_00210 [Streptomyces sp. HUAS 5]WGD44721.1 hypothetical protein PYS65_33910 [Streptomyces sp. HUAS 5]
MHHQDVQAAVAQMLEVLRPRTDEDWTVPAGPLEWNCRQTASHIGHDLLAYAGQLAARPADAYLLFDLRVRPTASPAEALQVAAACGGLPGSALATADPSLRAWHRGPCDPTGFAAMGVAEILLHIHDITRGLAAADTAMGGRARPAVPRRPARRARPSVAVVHWTRGPGRSAPPDVVDVEGGTARLSALNSVNLCGQSTGAVVG